MLDIQIDKQPEKMKTENPLLFTFFTLELCFTFQEPKFIKEYMHHNLKGQHSVNNILLN